MNDAPASPDSYDEAVKYLRSLIPMTDAEFALLEADLADRAFTVAQVASADIVADVLDSLERAVDKGTSMADWQAEMGQELEDAWGGEKPGRLETIFRTNVQTAYNAGSYEQRTDPDMLDARPYWFFDDVPDSRQSDICAALHGTVLPADDLFWGAHHPPLHFNCRSQIVTLSPEEAEEMGVTTDKPQVKVGEGFGKPPTAEHEWEPETREYPPEIREELEQRLAVRPSEPAPATPRPAPERPLPKPEPVAEFRRAIDITPHDEARADRAYEPMRDLDTPEARQRSKAKAVAELERSQAAARELIGQPSAEYLEAQRRELERLRQRPVEAFQPLRSDLLEAHFEAQGLGEVHREISDGWISSTATPEAMRLHAALEEMGVPGSYPPGSEVPYDEVDAELKRYVKEMYLMSQAAFRAQGMSADHELVLYRGVNGQLLGLADGDQTHVLSRPGSSWSDSEEVARRFKGSLEGGSAFEGEGKAGSGVIRVTVKAKDIFTHKALFDNNSEEQEFNLMGSQAHVATIVGNPTTEADPRARKAPHD